MVCEFYGAAECSDGGSGWMVRAGLQVAQAAGWHRDDAE
jgi:hypothetical protein